MLSRQFLIVFTALISFLFLPVVAVQAAASELFFQKNYQTISAEADNIFSAFSRDVGKAFRGLKDLVTGDTSDKSPEEKVEQTDEPADDSASTQTDARKIISSGVIRERNREIQQLLAAAGYYPGPVDGLVGNRTRVAIRQYQQANGLAVDGLPSISLLTDLRAREQNNTHQTEVISTPQSEIDYTTVEVIEEIELAIQPFGIPLGEKYIEEDFERVFSLYELEISNATVHPKKPHPLFNQYSISVDDGLIVNIHAGYTTSKKTTTGEPLTFNSASECDFIGNKVANALEQKYGPGKRFGKAGKWELIISNPKLQIRYFAKCGPTLKATNMSLSFQLAETLSRQEMLDNDQQQEIQEKILEYNHVF